MRHSIVVAVAQAADTPVTGLAGPVLPPLLM